MIQSDVRPVSKRGIRMSLDAARSVGISDGSRCWGVIVPDYADADRKHLVVSAIHPQSWFYLIRMKVLLEHRPGSLKRAAAAIRESANILMSECAVAGFHHGIWYSIVEPSRVERVHGALAGLGLHHLTPEALRKTWDDTIRMIGDLTAEAERLRLDLLGASYLGHIDDRAGTFGFLRTRTVKQTALTLYTLMHHLERQGDPADLEWVATCASRLDKNFERATEAHVRNFPASTQDFLDKRTTKAFSSSFPEAVQTAWLSRLAYYAMAGDNTRDPIPFKLDPSFGLISEQEHWLARVAGETMTDGLALVAYHQRDNYIRLGPLRQSEEAPLWDITVPYRVTAKQRGPGQTGCRGVLAEVLDVLQTEGIDLVQLLTNTTEQRETREQGNLQLAATSEVPKNPGHLEEMIAQRTGDRVGHVRVQRTQRERLFISYRFNCPYKALMRTVESAAAGRGFEPVRARSSRIPALAHVLGVLEECNACIQLYYLGPREDPSSHPQLFEWLNKEYLTAKSKDIPVVRVVDVSRMDQSWWRNEVFKEDRDIEPLSFDGLRDYDDPAAFLAALQALEGLD